MHNIIIFVLAFLTRSEKIIFHFVNVDVDQLVLLGLFKFICILKVMSKVKKQ